MPTSADFNSLLSTLLSNPTVQQLAPLAFVILFPLFVLSIRNYLISSVWSFVYMLSSISSTLPWNWTYSHSVFDGASSSKAKKKQPRTRAEQLAQTADAPTEGKVQDDSGYYPGLVNISGTYCFMNSTIQAMASLSYLQPHIDAIHEKAEVLDVPTPVVDALQDLLHTLNNPLSYHHAIRPENMIQTLSNPEPGKKSPLFSSREHQDAQELFQLVSEYVKKEAAAVDREAQRDRGLGGLAPASALPGQEVVKGVFDGLTANRRSCVECGYTEAVMHFSLDNWQLSVPRLAANCRLEDCLAEYTKLELLTDCVCRKCSMEATLKRLEQEVERVSEAAHDPNASASKKKRAREAKRLVGKVKAALEEGRVEEDIKGVKMERVFSKAHTKQAMVARPPPVLALHLNRSMHYGGYASKNTCRVSFPEYLDLTPFTTSGKLSTAPSFPLSSPPLPRSIMPTPTSFTNPRVLYRLAAVVCHYGQHSFGHYVCFRRKPRSPVLGPARYSPPRIVHYVGCECAECEKHGWIRDGDEDVRARMGRGWLRISDDSVSEVGVESVLAEGSSAFMLYYERVVQPRLSVGAVDSLKGSEETLKLQPVETNGSATEVMPGPLLRGGDTERVFRARIIRSVSTGRRSGSSEGSASPASGSSTSLPSQTESSAPSSEVDVKAEKPDTLSILPATPSPAPIPSQVTPSSPPSSPPRKSPKHRKHNPQPVLAPSPTRISPSRTVDLRA